MTQHAAYALPLLNPILSHGDFLRNRFVKDADEDNAHIRRYEQMEVDAQVSSGDYFIMLATILDKVNNDISDYAVRMRVEDIVSDLIYLHENYSIRKDNQTRNE